jgi:hypothetical protein
MKPCCRCWRHETHWVLVWGAQTLGSGTTAHTTAHTKAHTTAHATAHAIAHTTAARMILGRRRSGMLLRMMMHSCDLCSCCGCCSRCCHGNRRGGHLQLQLCSMRCLWVCRAPTIVQKTVLAANASPEIWIYALRCLSARQAGADRHHASSFESQQPVTLPACLPIVHIRRRTAFRRSRGRLLCSQGCP